MPDNTDFSASVHSLAARYSSEAESYRTLWAPVLHSMIRIQLQELRSGRVRRALDLGAGVGATLDDLRRAFPNAEVFAADRSLGMLALVPRNTPRILLDASSLALATGVLDFVLMAFVLFHLPEPRLGLAEARRVLRSGGMMALTTWAGNPESPATKIWDEELDRRGARPCDELEDLARHDLMDTPDKVRGLLNEAGFVGVEATPRTFEHAFTQQDFVRLRTGLGRHRRRLESLAPSAVCECLARAHRRFATLRGVDFTLRSQVIFASGRAPD